MANIQKQVNYFSKDFSEFRQNLVNFLKTYYKNQFIDYDESDPGIMFLEMCAYTGDVLSYYLDQQFKESILLYSTEQKNITQLAQSLGYKPRLTVPSKVKLTVYQLVPATGVTEKEPNYDYSFVIKQGAIVSDGVTEFRTLGDVDFTIDTQVSPREVSVYSVDVSDDPEFFLLKKTVYAKSGNLETVTFDFTDPIQYNKVQIDDAEFIDILDVYDNNNARWYEVDYLAQDTIFVELQNTDIDTPDLYQYADDAPYILKLKRVPKRFIVRINEDNKIDLRFGSGVLSNNDDEFLPNPQDVGLGTVFGQDKMNYEYNIANFLYTNSYGEVPSNVTLTVRYFKGGGIQTNVQPNKITTIIDTDIVTKPNLTDSIKEYCKNSIAVNNLEAASGGRGAETPDEIRNNAIANFASQKRVVIDKDYIFRTLTMPSRFGSIAKAYPQKNPTSQNNIDLYTLGYNNNKKLTTANYAIKKNLGTYLNQYRILTDTINIYDAYPINIKVSFEIAVLPGYNGKEVIYNCINVLKDYFNIDNWTINKPIKRIEIINLLANTTGVQSVFDDGLVIENLFDDTLGYWNNYYDIKNATKNNIIYPPKTPSIFEVRNPDSDIYGKIRNY